MKLKIKKEWYSAHFRSYLESQKEYNFLFGGRGSSKSHTVFLKHFLESFSAEYRNIFYCRHEWQTIRRTTFKDMCQFLELTGLAEYFDYSKAENSSMIFKNKFTGHTLAPYGLQDLDIIKGMANPTHIFVDEVDKCVPGVWGALNAVLRTPLVSLKQLTFMWNPVSEKSWLREYFFDEKDAYKLKSEFENNGYLNHSTFKNNDFIDHEQYGRRLILSSNGDQSVLDVEYHGLWGNMKKGNLFLFNFNRDKHISPTPIEINNANWICLSLDFNVNPLCGLVFQKDFHGRYIHCLGEIRLENSDVYALCDHIRERFDTRRVMIYGDAAGHARSVNSRGHKSSFEIIREELNLNWTQIKVPRGKPKNYVSDKRNLTNFLLSRHPQFIFSDVPFLIEDIENVQADDKGAMDKGKDATKSHLLDALCDFIYFGCADVAKMLTGR